MAALANRRPAWPKKYNNWQVIRFSLLAIFFVLAVTVLFFTIVALLDWTLLLLNIHIQLASVVASTLIILFIFPEFYRWNRDLVDSVFFPDTIGFREAITEACQTLTEIDTLPKLHQFLIDELPQQLQVELISLEKGEARATPPANTLALPLEMGDQYLGLLFIGPKLSGRSRTGEEKALFGLLQEQVSRVLSVAQLTEVRAQVEKVDQQKSIFLTNISNELRTPLNAVINLTGLVLDGAMGPISIEHQAYLRQAVNGSEYLMHLLDDILDITKIESGELTLHFGRVELSQIIDEVLPLIQNMFQHKPVELKVALADNLPPVLADRLRVRQILFNLLSNAAKFTKEGSVSITARSQGEWVAVSIEDTGIGIAPENLPVIFQDYQQVVTDNNQIVTNRQQHLYGTGLGMSITQALVNLHGGQIRVKSEVGQGSIFTFTLPHLFTEEKSA